MDPAARDRVPGVDDGSTSRRARRVVRVRVRVFFDAAP
jgi:hypothetical protein